MNSLDSFKELTETQQDLLNKDFYAGSLMLVTFSARSQSSTFHTRMSLNESGASLPVFLSAWERLSWGDWSLKGKKTSDGSLKLSSCYASRSYPLKLTLNYQQVSDSPNIQLEYRGSRLALDLLCKSEGFSLSFNSGSPSLGLGVNFSSDYSSLVPTVPTLVLWSKVAGSKFFLKHQNIDSNLLKPGNFEFGLAKWDEKSQIATSAKYSWANKSLLLSLAGLYKIDTNDSIKGRIASDGRVGLVYIHKLGDSINSKLSVETPCFPFRPTRSDLKVGLRLDFTL